MDTKELIKDKAKELNVVLSDDAVDLLGTTLDKLCEDILIGSEKIREYSGKEKVDEDAVKIAAYLDLRIKNLFK